MADGGETGPENRGGDRPQDPVVGRLRPDPSQPPTPTTALQGFLGDSDRPGFRRLYLTPTLDRYAEFRSDDVVDASPIPDDQAPFRGEQATRVLLNRDASVDFTRTRRHDTPADDFDIDLRVGRRRFGRSDRVAHTACDHWDCVGDRRGGAVDRGTVDTQCDQNTCRETWCHGNTCDGTCPGDNTCDGQTCPRCIPFLTDICMSDIGLC